MPGLIILAAIACLLAAAPAAAAAAPCMLCGDKAKEPGGKKPPLAPLAVEVETSLDFSKIGLVALNQGGTVELDPATGQRRFRGTLVDLGGFPVQGTVTVRGQPGESVQVDMPGRVTLVSSTGATVDIIHLTTDLPGNPTIGADGVLRFGFGGRLRVDGSADGEFRGTVRIVVDYR